MHVSTATKLCGLAHKPAVRRRADRHGKQTLLTQTLHDGLEQFHLVADGTIGDEHHLPQTGALLRCRPQRSLQCAEHFRAAASFQLPHELQRYLYIVAAGHLGLTEQLHARFFDAIHRERKPFNTAEQLAEWAAEQGADRDAILGTFNSFAVNNKLNFARIMSGKYGISGVPAIIVDGKYRTSVSIAGSHDALIEVINYLIDKAAAERQS